MSNLKKTRKKGLFIPKESSPISRRLFMRSVGLGGLALGLNIVRYPRGKNPFPQLGTFLHGYSEPAISNQAHYYGHDAVLDRYGVIAPWYRQVNGQCDFRIRIASETLKRYPWTTTKNAVASYPDYIFTSNWKITSDGTITPKHVMRLYGGHSDWSNGDLGQRSTSVLKGMVDYYRYSGDPAAIAHLTYMGDFLLDYCLTTKDHSWPFFPISVPTSGKAYGKADPNGMIQLDICASMGEGLLRAYQITKSQRWFDAARQWGDLFAERCNLNSNTPPWPRYANPESAPWKDDPRSNLQRGSITMVLAFLDELIRLGYTGKNQQIVTARDVGLRYLNDQVLQQWMLDSTCGYYFWDVLNETQSCSITADLASYLIKHKEHFPNWRNDARNILTLFLNRSSANPLSGGDVYNGAWAYPESSGCCGRSLWYAPLMVGSVMAQYGIVADDSLMRELAYRQLILQTYDVNENGLTEDNIDGGLFVNENWLNIAHPWPLLWVQQSIGWLPEELGPSRENHLVRTSSVVDSIIYGNGTITYTTFDSPQETIDVFRLSYVPTTIIADGQNLSHRRDLQSNGYTVKKLPNGDAIVWIRHDGRKKIIVQGSDPQSELKNTELQYDGTWMQEKDDSSLCGSIHFSEIRDASVTFIFQGNQIRLKGRTDQYGGQADVFIDGIKQSVFIDFWNPAPRGQQVLYYKNGLESGKHTLKIVARGIGNPYSQGSRIYIDSVQFSSESNIHNFPSGTGPTGPQRMIFGYTKREDYKDTEGHLWRPATEIVTPIGRRQDTLEKCWWTIGAKNTITNTPDQELYRYGYHASDFWVNITVGPGKYDVRLMFAVTDHVGQQQNGFDIIINENTVVHNLNIIATAGSLNKAVDLVFKDVVPNKGVIQIRLKGLPVPNSNSTNTGGAFVQALEIDQYLKGEGATPVSYN